MSHRLLSILGIWALLGACGIAAVVSSPAPSQNRPTIPSSTPRNAPDAVESQMRALEYQARVNMVLYTGQFGESRLATTNTGANAVALTLAVGK
jgi:hypothetical protein